MRALAALLLGAAALACGNGRSGGHGEPMPPAKPGGVVRSTAVRIPAAQAGSDIDGVRGLLATRRCAIGEGGRWLVCDLPPLEGGGHRVAIADLSAEPAAVAVGPGTLGAGGAAVIEGTAGARLPDGTALPPEADSALGPAALVRTTWHAPLAEGGPLVRLARIRDVGRWTLDAYDLPGGRRRWRTGAAELPGDPLASALAPDGGAAFLALRKPGDPGGFELVALEGATGTPRWRVPLGAMPAGPLLPAPDGAELAVPVRDTGRCQSCLKIVVLSTGDGRPAGEAALPEASIAAGAGSAGLAGGTVWFYRHVPAHATSELAPAGRTRVAQSCDYEVDRLDATGRSRTLSDAGGEWGEMTRGCEVRALVPLPGGHLAAIRVTGETDLTVVEFDAAP